MEFSEFEARKHNVASLPIEVLLPPLLMLQCHAKFFKTSWCMSLLLIVTSIQTLKASIFPPDLYKFCMYNTNTISLTSIQTWKHHLFFKFVQTLPVQYQSHFSYIMSLALYTMALMRGPWLALLWFIVDGIWSKRRDEWTVQASYDKVHTYKWLFSYLYIYSWS